MTKISFMEACKEIVRAYELRYWAVVSFFFVILAMLIPTWQKPLIVSLIVMWLVSGWLVGVRIANENHRKVVE